MTVAVPVLSRRDRPGRRGGKRLGTRAVPAVLALFAAAACGASSAGPGAAKGEQITLYTCVNDTTIQPVIKSFQSAHPEDHVALFRAPTGQLNARVAADVRSGGLRADVVWACDPLTMQAFVDQHLVGGWTPADAAAIPGEYRTADYAGAALLYMVAVYRHGTPAPQAWSRLTDKQYKGAVAVPNPAVAASALGALAYLADNPAYGLGFYSALKRNGAVQAGTPDDVTTGVAQGVYRVGMTTANSAYAARADGSPVDVAWPLPGAVAIYGPIALARSSTHQGTAKDFISYVLGKDGQRVLGGAGSYPTLPGSPGPTIPAGAPVVSPDWARIGKDKSAMLLRYRQIFGG
jgi:iron(III) transport system substrate-binding protein